MELSLSDVRELLGAESGETAFVVGEKYLIRTVTFFYTGRISQIRPRELVLTDAAWISDTGRFSDALRTGTLGEVEPFPSFVIVSRDSIVDATVWNHELPRDQV